MNINFCFILYSIKNDKPFKWLWFTIVLRFGFYIPVVLLADSCILINLLMILKTLAYVWTILIEFVSMIKKR